jgi:hypothetical protein
MSYPTSSSPTPEAPPSSRFSEAAEPPGLGANVYLWDHGLQNRFLARCVRPAVADLRERYPGVRFWFDRYDLRGPHIWLLTLPPLSAREETRSLLTRSFEDFLRREPEAPPADAGVIEARHAACRGRILCSIDCRPGLADDRTYAFFDHGRDGYPFHLTRYADDEGKLWGLLDELATWTLDQVAAGRPLVTALAWLSALDGIVAEVQGSSEPLWRHFASTLLLDLPERLATDEERALAALPGAVGEGNRRRFQPIWSRAQQTPPPFAPLPRLVETALSCTPPPELSSWALLREVAHIALKQLSVHGPFEVPMILFAWSQSLPTDPPRSVARGSR